MKTHIFLLGFVLLSLILTGCNSNIDFDNSDKISPPLQVGLYSGKDHCSFIVAPQDEFELTLVGKLIWGYQNKSIQGQVNFTFEKIGSGIEIENYKENQSIMLEINPYEEEKMFNTFKIKAIKKGFYFIDGNAELINTDDYRKPNDLNKNYSNVIGDSGVYICVVDSVEEIEEYCNFRNFDYFISGSIGHNQVEYIGSINKPLISNSNRFMIKN